MALIKCRECGASISKTAAACPQCGAAPKKKASLGIWLLAVCFIVGGAIVYLDYRTISLEEALEEAEALVRSATPAGRADAWFINSTSLDFTWSKRGSIKEADFIVTNNNTMQIKDIEVTCTHFAKSGTPIDSTKHVIYDVVPSISTKQFRDFNMGFIHSQAESTACKITNLAFSGGGRETR